MADVVLRRASPITRKLHGASERFSTVCAFGTPAGQQQKSPGAEPVRAVVLDDSHLAREHIEELVLLLVPVPLRGAARRAAAV